MSSNNKREINTLKRRHNNDDILLNIDKYNIEVLESDFKELKNINNKDYEDISKFVIHKNNQNTNTFYRDKKDKKSYIMYDNNYDSIEYNFDEKMIICYGKNEKPVFKHNLYNNLKKWFEYDHNNNELYTYTSDNLSYLNIYNYYGKLILTEKFNYHLIKLENEIEDNTKIIKYIDPNKNSKVYLTLEYNNDELISYISDFYRWKKIYSIDRKKKVKFSYLEEDSIENLYKLSKDEIEKIYLGDNYKTIRLENAIMYVDKYKYEFDYTLLYIYDEKDRKIEGLEYLSSKDIIILDVYFEYNNDGNLVAKKYGNRVEENYSYDENKMLLGISSYEKNIYGGIEKEYNCRNKLIKEEISGSSITLREYDDDGYLLHYKYNDFSAGDYYSGGSPDEYLTEIIQKYNENKIITYFKSIDDTKNTTIIKKFDDDGKILYEEFLKRSNLSRHLFEYDENGNIIYDLLESGSIFSTVLEHEYFYEYNDKQELVKATLIDILSEFNTYDDYDEDYDYNDDDYY